MPAVTDLTWTQLNTALKQQLNITSDLIVVDSYGVPKSIDIAKIVDGFSYDPNQTEFTDQQGVIKFLNRLHDACRIAQEKVNQGKAVGEKLTAFGAATATTPRGNLVPLTRTITSQADLSTSVKIVGTNA